MSPARFVVIALDEYGAPRAWAAGPSLNAATDEAIAQARAYLGDPTREARELRLVLATLGAECPTRDLGIRIGRPGGAR